MTAEQLAAQAASRMRSLAAATVFQILTEDARANEHHHPQYAAELHDYADQMTEAIMALPLLVPGPSVEPEPESRLGLFAFIAFAIPAGCTVWFLAGWKAGELLGPFVVPLARAFGAWVLGTAPGQLL